MWNVNTNKLEKISSLYRIVNNWSMLLIAMLYTKAVSKAFIVQVHPR